VTARPRQRRSAALRAACASACAVVVLPAQAALWGFVDGAGVAHVAGEPLDARYTLLLDDDPAAGDAPRAGAPRVPGKADGPQRLLTWMEFAPEVKSLQHLLKEAARQTGVDVELLQAVIAVESRFDPKAVSPRGAVGLMQLTPETADRYSTGRESRTPAPQRLLDPRTNILTGARMLADLTRRLGRIDLALAAWNAGEGAVQKAGGQMPAIDETRAHVHMVLELYWALLQRSLPRGAAQLRLNLAPPAASDP
jgi:hypothetical protein